MTMINTDLNITDQELLTIVLLQDMSDSIFSKRTVKEVIEALKQGFVLPENQKIYVTVYRAVKESEGLYSRYEIENLLKKGYAKGNQQGEVYLPDILFYTYLRKTQKTLISHGILEDPKKDVRNYETFTEQQAEQIFVVFSNFLKNLSKEKRQEILNQ